MVRTLLVAVLMFAGCAGRQVGNPYLDELRAWKGHDISTFIRQAGPPSQVFRMPDGSTMFTWSRQGPERWSGYTYAGFSSGSSSRSYCVSTFEVDAGNIIRRISTEGNACSVPVAPRTKTQSAPKQEATL